MIERPVKVGENQEQEVFLKPHKESMSRMKWSLSQIGWVIWKTIIDISQEGGHSREMVQTTAKKGPGK